MNNWFKSNITSPVINFVGKRKELQHFHKSPILIGGCGRSGTTLLLSILSAHPKIFALPIETDAFTQWSGKGVSLRPVRQDRFYRLLLRHSIPDACDRWCEKRPYNVLYIQEMLQYFGPDMSFIHIVRDPRAVCTSIHPSRPDQYWIPIERYVRDVGSGLVYLNHPQVLTLLYEDLISDTDRVIAQICGFIGEEFSKHIRNWYHYATVTEHAAWPAPVVEIQKDSISKWKSPEHAIRVEEVMSSLPIRKLMIRLGYS